MESFRWEDIDQTLVRPKLSKLVEEMQEAFATDKNKIAFDARQKGNSAYFLPAFLAKQEERTNEWASRQYEIFRDAWHEQGHSATPSFIRAVCQNGIIPLIQGRKAAVKGDLILTATRTQEPVNQSALANWERCMQRLLAAWTQRLEAEARALEHSSLQLANPDIRQFSEAQVREGISVCESRLTEINVALEAHKQALASETAKDRSNLRTLSKINQSIRELSGRKAKLESLAKEYRQSLSERTERPRTEKSLAHINSAFTWRSLQLEFKALVDEELTSDPYNKNDRWLRAYITIAKAGERQIELGGGINEGFKARFEAVATRAGIALEKPLKKATPLQLWLYSLFLNLLEHRSSELFAASEEGGIIKRVCEASVTYCARLEKATLEKSPNQPVAAGNRRKRRARNKTARREFSHSDDYRTIGFRGNPYRLTPQQAAIIRVLDEARKQGTCEVGKKAIQEKAQCGKLSDSFRTGDGPKLWKTLVVSVDRPRGLYKLNLSTPRK